MAQLTRCPVLRFEARKLQDASEAAPDVGRVELRPDVRREHDPEFLPPVAGRLALTLLAELLSLQGIDRPTGKRERTS
ncbi:hypothetical protein Amsp01_024470 [Amycolatopsis sp. NBRC 101858]|nr:hypothetical protein Amsp01_024470 [Amycolatopsis sp. NBRC 101858]